MGQGQGCGPGVPEPFLKRLGSDRSHQKLGGGEGPGHWARALSPQGHLVGTEAGLWPRTRAFLEGRQGRGVALQAVGPGPTLLSAPRDRAGTSPWLASQGWGRTGLNPCQNLPGGPHCP